MAFFNSLWCPSGGGPGNRSAKSVYKQEIFLFCLTNYHNIEKLYVYSICSRMMTLSAFGSRLSVGVEKTKLPLYFWLNSTVTEFVFTTNIKICCAIPYTQKVFSHAMVKSTSNMTRATTNKPMQQLLAVSLFFSIT